MVQEVSIKVKLPGGSLVLIIQSMVELKPKLEAQYPWMEREAGD